MFILPPYKSVEERLLRRRGSVLKHRQCRPPNHRVGILQILNRLPLKPGTHQQILIRTQANEAGSRPPLAQPYNLRGGPDWIDPEKIRGQHAVANPAWKAFRAHARRAPVAPSDA